MSQHERARTDLDNVASELASKFGLSLRMTAGPGHETLSHALLSALHGAYVAGLQNAYDSMRRHIDQRDDPTRERHPEVTATVIVHESEW